MTVLKRVAPLLALLAATMPAINAQEPRRLAQSDSVPLDLVTALVSAGGLGGEPQILVGSLPGWIANRLTIPPNARVLGAAFIGNSVVGVVDLPTSPEAAIAELKQGLAAHGWKAPPAQPSYGGFRPAGTAQMYGGSPTSLTVCGDQQMLSASAARRRGSPAQLVIRVTPTAGYSPCTVQPVQASTNRTTMPTLYNPPSTNDLRAQCTWNTGTSGTGAQLQTSMTSEAILDHYARQMQDSGWRSISSSPSILGRSWTRPDSTGTPIEASITVTVRDSLCRELSLQVRPLKKP